MTTPSPRAITYKSRIDGAELDDMYLALGSAQAIANLIAELAGIYERRTGRAYDWDPATRFPIGSDSKIWDKEDRVVMWITLFGDVEKAEGHWVHAINRKSEMELLEKIRKMFPNHDAIMRKPIR